jgi:pyruvyltransferase
LRDFVSLMKVYARKIANGRNLSIFPGDGNSDSQIVVAKWSQSLQTERNLGDALNPAIIQYLTGAIAQNADRILVTGHRPVFYFMGSILDNLAYSQAIVCGAGFKSASANLLRLPANILAVRGELTRKRFLSLGVSCPEVYCDPGLFVSDLFKFEKNPKYDVGIVPHIVDKSIASKVKIVSNKFSYIYLDIESEPASFFEQLASCRYIASSSLHGLIFAESYGIPSLRLKYSEFIAGGDFKYDDFYSSVGEFQHRVLSVDREIHLAEIIDMATVRSTESVKALYLKELRKFSSKVE